MGVSKKRREEIDQHLRDWLSADGVSLEGFKETSHPNIFKKDSSLSIWLDGYVYWDRLFYTELNPISLADFDIELPPEIKEMADAQFPNSIEKGTFKAHIDHLSERIHSYAFRDRWDVVFALIDKRMGMLSYLTCFRLMPINKRWDAFVEMYTRAELGFEMLEGHYSRIFETANYSRKRETRLRKLAKKVGDGKFTIYHGAKLRGSKWDPKDYYSWTLSQKTANFFAVRFSDQGQIWEREIDLVDAVDYLTDRGEEEILIDYSQMTRKGEKRYAPIFGK